MVIIDDDEGNPVKYMTATREEVFGMYGHIPNWQVQAAASGWSVKLDPRTGVTHYVKRLEQ